MVEVRQLCLDLGYSNGGLDYLIKKKNIKKKYAHNPKGSRIVVITENEACLLIDHKREFKYNEWISAKELSLDCDMTSRELCMIASKNKIYSKKTKRFGTRSTLETCFSPNDSDKLKDIVLDLSGYVTEEKSDSADWTLNRSRGLYTRIQADYIMSVKRTEYMDNILSTNRDKVS